MRSTGPLKRSDEFCLYVSLNVDLRVQLSFFDNVPTGTVAELSLSLYILGMWYQELYCVLISYELAERSCLGIYIIV